MRDESMRDELVEVLLGRRPADRVVSNARVVDVVGGNVKPGGIAIRGDRIAKVGDVDGCVGPETEVVDASGACVAPGLIETHLHAYETNLGFTEYARLLLIRGTTTVPEAAYGIGQVRGLEGVRFCIDELRRTPMNVMVQVPALGYLQNIELGLPGSPNDLDGDDLFEIMSWSDCVGLEEPPYVPIDEKDPVIARLIPEALSRGQVVMGHGAGLTGAQLEAYSAAGVTADHEAITAEEAIERLQAGMLVSMRESDVAHNQRDLQRAITEHGADPANFMFCADVLDPVTAARVGHIDNNVRIAIDGGIEPIDAVRMATINAARYYRLEHEVGSLTPGRRADLVLVDGLEDFEPHTVVAGGKVVVSNGEFVHPMQAPSYPAFLRDTVNLARPARTEDFRVGVPRGAQRVTVRVIGAELLVSDERHLDLGVNDGSVRVDTANDVLKIAMLDRYGRDYPPAVGFIQGYGLKRGAIGTTYNPMYHNVLVMGTNDDDLAVAANSLAEMGGGFVAVDGGEVVGSVPLPLCGLLSDQPAESFVPQLEQLYRTVADMGCSMASPYHNLAFTAVCGELPFLKLSHLGMFDVQKREVLPALV